jgi:23S rRNA pseudouridine2605 synthase
LTPNPPPPPRRRRARPIPSPKKPQPPAPAAERLQKLLAAAGLGSRREIEQWIAAGRVAVDGKVAQLGQRALPSQAITVDGRPVRTRAPAGVRVLLYHKPVGELVTRSDPGGRATVFSRLPPGRWVAVGRLDINSSGLLLFTDSGDLANRLMHPRYEIEREYLARVQGRPDVGKLLHGVDLEDGTAAFDRIEEARGKARGANRWYRVTLREGRNREVRRLFEAVGCRVSRLMRVRYGPVELPADLAAGSWREMENPAILQRL